MFSEKDLTEAHQMMQDTTLIEPTAAEYTDSMYEGMKEYAELGMPYGTDIDDYFKWFFETNVKDRLNTLNEEDKRDDSDML